MWISLNQLNAALDKLENTKTMSLAYLNITVNEISILLEDYEDDMTTHKLELTENVNNLPAINITEIQNLLEGEMEFRYFSDGSWYILHSSKEESDFEIIDLCEKLEEFYEFKTKLLELHPEDLIKF